MRVVTQKLQSLTQGDSADADLATQLDNCRDDSATLRSLTLTPCRTYIYSAVVQLQRLSASICHDV